MQRQHELGLSVIGRYGHWDADRDRADGQATRMAAVQPAGHATPAATTLRQADTARTAAATFDGTHANQPHRSGTATATPQLRQRQRQSQPTHRCRNQPQLRRPWMRRQRRCQQIRRRPATLEPTLKATAVPTTTPCPTPEDVSDRRPLIIAQDGPDRAAGSCRSSVSGSTTRFYWNPQALTDAAGRLQLTIPTATRSPRGASPRWRWIVMAS